ncbi:flagellar hook-length control protein FliK [Shewanella morhuae]|uniref:Flagellar hook-length control protein FliK n=1 Tax=Shewanella morhuae TaxID=365591 RepID=A0ABX5HXG0_9GAMM|nr:flagellar hook-length control protein FliK [Shewanella morhuae]PTA51591.1 flagellar hook-length control protein FliK [Shewanella morhuae]
MIADLLSTRPVGANTHSTAKVTSAVDQDKSASFTSVALAVDSASTQKPLEESQCSPTAEHCIFDSAGDNDTLLNQSVTADMLGGISFATASQSLPLSLLNSAVMGADSMNLDVENSLTTISGLATASSLTATSHSTGTLPLTAAAITATETVNLVPTAQNFTSFMLPTSTETQREALGVGFALGQTSAMTSSTMLAGEIPQTTSINTASSKTSSTFSPDFMLASFNDDAPLLKSDPSLFQRVFSEFRGHEVKDINAMGLSQTAAPQAASATQWGPVSLTPAAPLAQQTQEILTPLKEHLRFQVDQHIKRAELRLDPPELGKIELNIRLEGDRLQVQMHAVNPAIRDALLNGLERLRVDLAMDHGGQIDVDVGQGDAQQQQQETALFPSSIAAETTAEQVVDTAHREKSQLDLLA